MSVATSLEYKKCATKAFSALHWFSLAPIKWLPLYFNQLVIIQNKKDALVQSVLFNSNLPAISVKTDACQTKNVH